MPKIPRYEQQKTITRDAPAARSGGSGAGLPGHAKAQIGTAISQSSEVIAQVGKKFADLRDLTQTTSAHTSAQQALSDLEQQAERDPDPFNTDHYSKEIERIKNESASGISDSAARIRFQGSLDMSALQSQVSINERLRRRQIDSSLAELTRSNETRALAFQTAATPQEKKLILSQMYQSIDAFADHGVLSRADSTQLKSGIAPKLIEGEISRDMRSDPSGTLARLDAGYYEQIAPLDVDKKSKLREMTEAMAKKQQAEEEKQKDLALDELHRQVLLGIVDRKTGIGDLNDLLAGGQISAKDYEAMSKRLTDVNDSDLIPQDEKVARFFEISKRFSDLHGSGWSGAQVDKETLLPKTAAKGNRLQKLKEFRNYLAASAPYLTEEQERAFYLFTQKDWDTQTSAKAGMFANFTNWLQYTLGPTGVASTYLSKAFSLFDKNVPVNMAEQTVGQLKTQATFAANPNRSRYTVGQVVKNPNGLEAEVTGFDEKGNPVLKWKR